MTDPGPRRRARARPAEVTIGEVARQAEVSVATVSRALRGLPNVAPATRARIEKVAAELRYEPDTHASRLASGRNDAIALVVPAIDNWYFSQVAAGVESVIAASGMDVLLQSVAEGHGRARVLAEASSVRRRLDGLVLVDVILSPEEIDRLGRSGVAIVTVGQRTEVFPSVTIDSLGAARTAVRHLLRLGHGRIAMIGGRGGVARFDVPTHRRNGWLDALAEAGIPHDDELEVDGGYTVQGGADAMVALLTSAEPPTAVFAQSDEMAFGAMRAARDLDVAIPRDLSICGFDDHPLASVVGLTTVHQDPLAQGVSAGHLLLNLIRDDDGSSREVVGDTRLVVRTSTKRWTSPK